MCMHLILLVIRSFDSHVVVILWIHDCPIMSTLVGRVTKGYYACVSLDKVQTEQGILAIVVPTNHTWTRNMK